MPAVPPSGERQSVLRPILLAALALFGLLGAAWMVWPRLQGQQATAPTPQPTPVAAAPASPAPLQAAPPPATAPAASAPAATPAPQATSPASPAPQPQPASPPAAASAPPASAPAAPAAPQATPQTAPATASAPPPASAAPQAVPPPSVASTPAAPPATPPASAPPTPATAETRRPAPPSFDIVRINARGQAVMAGRAEPGSEIVIRDGDAEIGRVTADARGEWVFVSDRPLSPGGRELTLTMRAKDGQELTSVSSVVLVVPERGQDVAGRPATPQTERPIALLVPGADAAPRVLQAPAATPPAAATPATTDAAPAAPQPIPTAPSEGTRAPAAGALGLEIVDYDDEGQVRFTGTAPARAAVRVYVDNAPVGDVLAGPDGRWTLSPSVAVPAGTHALRLDQMTPQGRVAARVELPFQRASLPPEALREGKVVVQPGQSLWRIARARYGKGAQYIVIYEANRDAIRDPARIYPGQIFDLPIQSN